MTQPGLAANSHKQPELGAGEGNLGSVLANGARLRVDLDIAEDEGNAVPGPNLSPAHERPDPGGQLLRHHRLGQVVVCSRLQAFHNVPGPRQRRHDDDRHVTGPPQLARDLEAVQAGQQEVDQDDVGANLAEVFQAVLTAPASDTA